MLAAAAGARRTSSAYPRYLRASHASDLLVSVAGTGMTGFYGALARQPGVALLARGIGLNVQPADRAGRLDWAAATEAPGVLGTGARPGRPPGAGRAAAPAGPGRRSRWTRSRRLPCTCESAARSP